MLLVMSMFQLCVVDDVVPAPCCRFCCSSFMLLMLMFQLHAADDDDVTPVPCCK
jgi:hypothetical protein